MICENARRLSRIIGRIYGIAVVAMIACNVRNIAYCYVAIIIGCTLDIGLWLNTCKKNKDSEEYPSLKKELRKAIVSFVLCMAVIFGYSLYLKTK